MALARAGHEITICARTAFEELVLETPDARNGVIVRLGQRLGIPTPLNAMAVTILKASAAIDATGHSVPS